MECFKKISQLSIGGKDIEKNLEGTEGKDDLLRKTNANILAKNHSLAFSPSHFAPIRLFSRRVLATPPHKLRRFSHGGSSQLSGWPTHVARQLKKLAIFSQTLGAMPL